MGNNNISCCGNSNDIFNLQLTNSHQGSVYLKKLQARLHYFLQRVKISKFFETNKAKTMQILSKQNCQFLKALESEEILRLNDFMENGFSLRFPFFDNSKLLINKESNQIISENIKNYKNEISEFLGKISNRSFQNIVKLPVYKDIVTEDVYYSYLNLLNKSSIGQYVIIKKNGVRIELNIKDPKTNTARGIVIYPNGEIYIGSLLIKKFFFNHTDGTANDKLNNLNNYDKDSILKAKTNEISNNGIQISESHTQNNYPNSNYTGNTNNNQNKNNSAINQFNKEIPLNEENLLNSFLVEEKNTPSNLDTKGYDPFSATEEFDNIEFLVRIVNATPFGQGVLIQKNQIILSGDWEGEFIHEGCSFRIINEKFELEAKIKNLSIDFSSVVLFDYVDHSKYEGEVIAIYETNVNTITINPNINDNNKDNSNKFGFEKLIKEGKGKLYSFNGEIYEGGFKSDFYHGEGVLFEPRKAEGFLSGMDFLQSFKKQTKKSNDDITTYDNNKKNNLNTNNPILNGDGVTTKGVWSYGKLNGKGLVIKHNMKQKCVWRFGRLVNSVLSLNKKVKLNERVFDFLGADDLSQLAYVFKTKSMLNFLKKDNCKNLIKLKVFECLAYNVPERDREIKKFLLAADMNTQANAKSNLISNTNTNNNNQNNSNSQSLDFYNKKLFNYLCKAENYLHLFDALFEHCYDSYIPAIGVKCNGGYPNKILHYSNAFDPSRSNNYSSNYVKAFGKNVDITGALISQSETNKIKVLDKYSKLTSRGDSPNKQARNSFKNKNNKNLISLDVENKNNFTGESIEDIQYLCLMAKLYAELKRKVLGNKKTINQANGNNDLIKELMKFLFSINFTRLFKYKKNSNYHDLERKAEFDNLTFLQAFYANIANKYSEFYKFDYNNRVITDIQVYEKLNVSAVASTFCINKISIDIPFNVHELNKLTLPAKTIVFFLHKGILTKEELLNFQLDPSEAERNFKSTPDTGYNINISPKVLEIANDAFLSKYPTCVDDQSQLTMLLNEISKVNNKNHSNSNNNKSLLNALEKTKASFKNDNLNILNVSKTKDNLFIEFDTESNVDAKFKLLGICFLKDYDMPNIINLKPFYHTGNMVTARLVNQQVLMTNFKPSAIDVGSITFYGEEFKFDC